MAKKCASEATILDMLGALETEIASLRSAASAVVPPGHAVIDASVFKAEMERAALSPLEFSKVSGIPRDDVEDWFAGRVPAPAWTLVAVHLTALITPPVRRKLMKQPLGKPNAPVQRTHPFSRIEDL